MTQRQDPANRAVVDRYIDSNKDALNASIEKARAEFQRGDYLTLDQVRANLSVQRQHFRMAGTKDPS
jgi:hypothetical protein